MKIEGSCVTFEPCDAAFVKKFGPLEAANMVLDYHSVHPNMPFLYDAEQLAGFFGISCGVEFLDTVGNSVIVTEAFDELFVHVRFFAS